MGRRAIRGRVRVFLSRLLESELMDTMALLYELISERKESPVQGSYTSYLFGEGLDKILKKIGEESAEVIIAAKGGESSAVIEELCDLYYHTLVLMCEKGIDISQVISVLEDRRQKQLNLKDMKSVDRNT